MRFRRLRWHSRRRQDALFSMLETELNRWLDAWSVESECLILRQLEADAYRPVAPLKWLRVSADNGVLCLGAPELHFESLGGILAKANMDDALHIGRRIGDRAIKALFAQWIKVSTLNLDVQEGTSPSDEVFHPRFGHMLFSLKGAGFSGYLILDPDLVDNLVPGAECILEPLTSRASSFGSEKIELNVSLDLGATTLSDTIGLQVGDVLLSTTSIDSPFQLTHTDMRQLANVRLVRKQSKRAVQIDTPKS